MKRKYIAFTAVGKAELLDGELPELKSAEVLTRMEYRFMRKVVNTIHMTTDMLI